MGADNQEAVVARLSRRLPKALDLTPKLEYADPGPHLAVHFADRINTCACHEYHAALLP